MARIAIDDLVAMLPQVSRRFALAGTATEIAYVPEPDRRFVPPTLDPAAGGSLRPSLILVEARAAVGKSTLAKHVACMTGSPLWDLSEIFVGSGTVMGRLVKTFGPRVLNDVIAAAAEGDFLLVVDALDEAEMHTSGPSFDTFLEELVDFAGPRATRPRLILFGRSETIEYVELYLGGKTPIFRCSIEGFDQPSADLFIERYLEGGNYPATVRTAHQRRPSVFREARDHLYAFFIAALSPDRDVRWQSDRVREFMGYAPVLATLTDFLAGYADNYQRLGLELSRLEEDDTVAGPPQWELLTMVLRRLLLREQGKFLKQANRFLDSPADLYSPDAQCSMLLREIDRTLEIDIPEAVPLDKADGYRSLVANALMNHPFRGSVTGYANHVMRDYVHAWALRGGAGADLKAVRKALRTESYLPSPLLGRFFLSVAEPANRGLTCSAEDFSALYESFVALREESLSVLGDETGVTALIGAETGSEPIYITIEQHQDGIPFRRRLANAEVRGVSVIVGTKDRVFNLGPNALLDVELLDVQAEVIRVYNRLGPVRMHAAAGYLRSGSREPKIAVFGEAPFEVSWDEIRYPWVIFQVERWTHGLDDRPDDDALRDAFGNFARIVRYFFQVNSYARRPLLGPPTDAPTFRHTAVATPAATQMFDYLLTQKILVPIGSRTFLDPRRLKALGISLTDCHLRVLSGATRAFLAQYLASRT
jgi:hypothetical protein